jgi:hypothetical protein
MLSYHLSCFHRHSLKMMQLPRNVSSCACKKIDNALKPTTVHLSAESAWKDSLNLANSLATQDAWRSMH